MASSSRNVVRFCTCLQRTSNSHRVHRAPRAALFKQPRSIQSQRWESTEAAAASTNPKIEEIVNQISKLTLIETADLVSTLKSRLNIPDMPMGGFVAGGSPGAGAASAPAVEEDEPAPAAEEKTLFNLNLKSFETAAKPKVIKEVKQLLGLSLVESKKFVESAPKLMKESMPKEDCERIIKLFKELGAVVEME